MRVTRGSRIIAGLAAALFAAPASAASPASPLDVTRAFYHWYFIAQPMRGGWMAHLAGAKPYLEPRFYAELARVGPIEERTHREVIDSDPFIAAQVDALGATARPGAIHGSRATVPVTVRLDHAPDRTLTIVLESEGGGWRITDFMSGSDSARKDLETDLAGAR